MKVAKGSFKAAGVSTGLFAFVAWISLYVLFLHLLD